MKEDKEQKQNKKIKDNVSFLNKFISALKEDKIYLISLIITLLFLGTIFIVKVKEAEGLFSKKNDDTTEVDQEATTTITSISDAKEDVEEVDVTDYVGIYSKEIKLDNVIQMNDTCNIDSYKLIYQVKKDRSIKKYFYNSCIGTIKIWDDELKYNSIGGARYIAANDINFIFNDNTLKEIDGYKYNVDDDITKIEENKSLDEVELYFYGNNIVYLTNTNLILIVNNKVTSPITDEYKNNGGDLEKRFYKSENIKYQFNFIVFKNAENVSCYDNEESDDPLYTIYSIRYDVNSNNFLTIKEVLARSKSNSCKNYKEDLVTLKE